MKLKEWVRLHSRGLAHLGIALSDEDFETLIDTVDNDKSGCIDYNEFVEDLKSGDMQTGGFMGADPDQQKMGRAVASRPKSVGGDRPRSRGGLDGLQMGGQGVQFAVRS